MARNSENIAGAISAVNGIVGAQTEALAQIKTTLERKAAGAVDISLGITSAAVGDIVKVKAVDENGKPTEWEAYTPENFEVLIDTQVSFTDGVNAISLDLTKNDIAKEFVCWLEFSKSTGGAWGGAANAMPAINGAPVGYWILNKDFSVYSTNFFADVNYEKPTGWCDWMYAINGISTNIVGLNRQLAGNGYSQTRNGKFTMSFGDKTYIGKAKIKVWGRYQ